jgi:hypothetical protein
MSIDPLKKLIIINGVHLGNIPEYCTESKLFSILNQDSFKLVNEIKEIEASIYESSNFNDYSKQTHLIINLDDLVSNLKYYTTKK